MKKGNVLAICVLIISMIVVGCIKTPTIEPVANKNMKIDEQSAASVQSDEATNVPDKVEDTFTSKNELLNVEVLAEIQVPTTTDFSMYRIVPKEITLEDVQNYANVFFGSKQLYNTKPMMLVTQNDIINTIKKMQSYLNILKADNPVLYAEEEPLWRDEIDKQFKRLKNEKLPLDFEYTPIKSLQFSKPEGMIPQLANNYEELKISAEISKEKRAEIRAFKNKSNKMSHIVFDNREKGQNGEAIINDIDTPVGLNISKEEAIKIATEKLAELKITDVSCSDIVIKPTFLDFYLGKNAPIEELEMYYEIYFTKILDGVMFNHIDNNALDLIRIQQDVAQYTQPWMDEEIAVCVDDTGVFAVTHNQPSEITDKIGSNVAILPFKNIYEKFKSQISIANSWIENSDYENMTFYINKIKLGYAKVIQPNSNLDYITVPAWDFYGYFKVKYVRGIEEPALNENNEFTSESNYALSFLTLNAIDGSVINRDLGY